MSDSPRRTLLIWLLVFTPLGYCLALGLHVGNVLRDALHRSKGSR